MKEEKIIETDILICGAGPAGIFLGIVLGRFGLRPMIIERLHSPSQHTKAGTLQPRTMEILNEFGLADAMIKNGQIVYRNNFYSKQKRISTLDYSKIPTNYNYLLSISQPRIEGVLMNALQNSGLKIERDLELIDFRREGEQIIAEVKNLQTQETMHVRAKYLIGADGGKSKVRTLLVNRGELNLLMQAKYRTSFIMGDFRFKNYPFSENERHSFFKEKNVLVFVPMPDSIYRIVALQNCVADPNVSPTVKDFQKVIVKFFGHELEIESSEWLSGFSPSRFLVNSFGSDRVFLVGDAAHIISPIGAQGINLALEDVYNLGWKLGMSINGSLNPTLLASYNHERSSVAKLMLKQSHINQLLIGNIVGNFILRQLIKTTNKPKANLELAFKHTLFDMRYENGITRSATPKQKKKGWAAGDKLLMAIVEYEGKGDHQLFELLPYDSLTLLINFYSEELKSHDVENLSHFENPYSNVLRVFALTSKNSSRNHKFPVITADLASDFGGKLRQSSPFLIIRPDKFILADFKSHELDRLHEYMKTITPVDEVAR